jgi:hypothetical protein
MHARCGVCSSSSRAFHPLFEIGHPPRGGNEGTGSPALRHRVRDHENGTLAGLGLRMGVRSSALQRPSMSRH